MVDLPGQDKELQQLPADMLRNLQERAAADLFFLCKGVLGYHDLTEGCHGPLCTFHDVNDSRFKLTLIPRGHLKSTIVTIGKRIQTVVRDWNSRSLIGNETSTNAERFLSVIKQHAETNKVFRTLFSHIIPKKPVRWSQSELLFNREWIGPEPTIDTIGMTGAMTSRHYTHLGIDDPVSEEAARSKLVMDDVINRLSKLFSLMVDPEHNCIDLVGTRWALYDVYSHFMDWFGPRMSRYIRAAIEDGHPIWPERFSLDTLALIRDDPKMGEYNFACLYMNNPRDIAVQNFNVQDLRFWRWSSDEESVVLYNAKGEPARVIEIAKLDIVTTVDVRYGEAIRNDRDRDAIVTTGTTEEGDVIVLDSWAQRGTPLQVVDKLCSVVKAWSPRCIGIQKVGWEMALKWFAKAAFAREGIYANIVPVKPGGPGKPHIKGLQPIAATGHLYILPTQHGLRTELADYPLGKFDDEADTLALQQQLWRGVLSPDSQARYRASEKRLLRELDGRGGPPVPELLRDDRGHPQTLDDIGYDAEEHRWGPQQQWTMR